MIDLEANKDKTIKWLATKFEDGELDNDALVQIIELCGSYLNLKTIADYSKDSGLSYNGVKNCRQIKELFNCKFVIDNE